MKFEQIVPECTMEKHHFVDHGQKYDALSFLEQNKICAVYRDDELWIAINKVDKNYKKAHNRIRMIITGEL